ncbi:MAG: HlyD family secretion protein, partial [Alphaproteobacteria bacterium]|nr:HlyD family secretion protein [Alphaproteobacteria bacterium]
GLYAGLQLGQEGAAVEAAGHGRKEFQGDHPRDLVIEAKVATNDIDNVRVGQNAYIVFPSFAQRNLKRIGGRVERVSPDALEDNRSGERYYTARVTVDRQRLREIAPEIELSPGMPAEVFIETGERTMLEYLMQPFLQSVERAFREK